MPWPCAPTPLCYVCTPHLLPLLCLIHHIPGRTLPLHPGESTGGLACSITLASCCSGRTWTKLQPGEPSQPALGCWGKPPEKPSCRSQESGQAVGFSQEFIPSSHALGFPSSICHPFQLDRQLDFSVPVYPSLFFFASPAPRTLFHLLENLGSLWASSSAIHRPIPSSLPHPNRPWNLDGSLRVQPSKRTPSA